MQGLFSGYQAFFHSESMSIKMVIVMNFVLKTFLLLYRSPLHKVFQGRISVLGTKRAMVNASLVGYELPLMVVPASMVAALMLGL